MAGPLQGDRQLALVAGTRAGLAARLDLGALREVPAEPVHFLVVDLDGLVGAERADLAAAPVAVVVVALLRSASGGIRQVSVTSSVRPSERQVVDVGVVEAQKGSSSEPSAPSSPGSGTPPARHRPASPGGRPRSAARGRSPDGRSPGRGWKPGSPLVAVAALEVVDACRRSARSCTASGRPGPPTGGSGAGPRRRPCCPCGGTRRFARPAGPTRRRGTTRSPPATRRRWSL